MHVTKKQIHNGTRSRKLNLIVEFCITFERYILLATFKKNAKCTRQEHKSIISPIHDPLSQNES